MRRDRRRTEWGGLQRGQGAERGGSCGGHLDTEARAEKARARRGAVLSALRSRGRAAGSRGAHATARPLREPGAHLPVRRRGCAEPPSRRVRSSGGRLDPPVGPPLTTQPLLSRPDRCLALRLSSNGWGFAMVVLVVGANGQLGARCAGELLSRGHTVRGTVRARDRGQALEGASVEVVEADLTSAEGLSAALAGVDSVVATANPSAPRAGDDPEAVYAGLLRLVDDADAAGVRRLVLASVPTTQLDDSVPLPRHRRQIEARMSAARCEDVVLRFPPFMESWLALIGSSIPLRGEPFATIGRPSPFLRVFRRLTGSAVERRGVMLVPGRPSNRNAFIGLQDVAAACVLGVERPDLADRAYDVGGPEVLTWRAVAAIYEDVLHRRVRIVSTPAAVYAAAASVLSPVAAGPSATMPLNRRLAATEAPLPPGGGALLDPAAMLTVREFLEAKAALPET